VRSILAGLRQLVIPWGAGPGAPRIEIGGGMPAELVARYAAIVAPESVIGGMIFYRGVTDVYAYMILTNTPGGFIRLCVGGKDSNGDIAEFWNWEVTNGAASFGRIATALSDLFGNQFFTNVEINSGANLIVNAGAGAFIQNTADLTIESGGDIFAQAGSRVIVQDTAELTGEAGALFEWDGMRHIVDTQQTASTRTLTTYANLTNLCGFAFTAPPSGIITFLMTARLSINSATSGAALTPWIGTGSTVGSGTEVLAASDLNMLLRQEVSSASRDYRFGGHYTHTGLTPGDVYNISMRMRTVTAGTATFDDITVTGIPSP